MKIVDIKTSKGTNVKAVLFERDNERTFEYCILKCFKPKLDGVKFYHVVKKGTLSVVWKDDKKTHGITEEAQNLLIPHLNDNFAYTTIWNLDGELSVDSEKLQDVWNRDIVLPDVMGYLFSEYTESEKTILKEFNKSIPYKQYEDLTDMTDKYNEIFSEVLSILDSEHKEKLPVLA